MAERIQIGIIPDNLRHEETIVQIAEVLDDLDSTVSYIFNCVDKRLSQYSERLLNVRNRATKLEDRLQYLQTSLNLKAVKMFSAAKYPANHTYNEYQMVITPPRKTESKIPNVYKSSVSVKDIPEPYSSSNCKTEDGKYAMSINLQEKLQFYHVRSKPNKEPWLSENNKESFPPHLSSVSALMLFNGADNPYEKSVKQLTHWLKDKQQIEDAPNSIVQPWDFSETDLSSSYLYTPTLGEVPQINVPLTLPDLPGIVDDEKFVVDFSSQSPIAPSSAATTPTVRLDLPTPNSEEKELDMKKDEIMANLPALNEDDSSKHSDKMSVPLPPPPPLSNLIDPPSNLVSTNFAPVTSSPPPPPPPPPPAPTSVSNAISPQKSKNTGESIKLLQSQEDDRSNLMAAIRNAGGIGRAKLRRTMPSEDNVGRWSSASVGGDLMADLHAKLALRRKGIAGSAGGALERMSNLIPPPPKPNETSTSDRNSATSEYDSQPDTDDWDE